MLHSIKSFFNQNVKSAADAPAPEGDADQRLKLAAAALLLELAHADDKFTTAERKHIVKALMRHFDVSEATAKELIRLAEEERRDAVDLYQFARLIVENYDEGQRLVLAEVMWGVVQADGELSHHEDYLMQKLSHLLELRPGYLNAAKKRALEKGKGGA